MTLPVCRNWSKVVGAGDDVYVVGDAVMGRWRDGLAVFADLPGTKHLILGNHDRLHPRNSNGHRYVRAFMEVFESVSMAAAVRVGGLEFVVSHFPYEGDHTPVDRDVQWRLRDEGAILVHGHTHTRRRVSWSSRGSLQLCVCAEAWNLTPVSGGELAVVARAALDARATLEASAASL